MFDKEWIKKVCNLTCSWQDIEGSQTARKYDVEFPFEKYYNIQTIIGAVKKYQSKEWTDRMLAHWACIYDWILCGGFEKNVKENFNSFEKFLVAVITWDLDGLSFFDEEDFEDEPNFINKRITFYEHFDHIWQSRRQWACFYALVGEFDEENESQYVVLVNDNTREYMIIACDHIKNGYQDERIKFLSKKEFIDLVEQIKNAGYNLLPCAEEFYYEELENK